MEELWHTIPKETISRKTIVVTNIDDITVSLFLGMNRLRGQSCV